MAEFRYKLEDYKGSRSRYQCPECGKKKSFARYIDVETGNHIADHIGRCNRESKCNYHLTPKVAGIAQEKDWKPAVKVEAAPLPIKYISSEAMIKSMAGYKNNYFMEYMASVFGIDSALELASKYNVGTSKKWLGANIFYQVDSHSRVRRGKVMLYDPETGKRNHEKNHSVHALSGIADHKPTECFFGEHLLTGNNRSVAIVESEKTAMIASLYLPDLIWIACGGLSMLNYEKCKALAGKDVILYPDLGGFDKWQEKAGLLLPKITKSWKVSSLLEKTATQEERDSGLDLADYLLRYQPEQFTKQAPVTKVNVPAIVNKAPVVIETEVKDLEIATEDNSGETIEGLVHFFEHAEIPQSTRLDQCTYISDVPAFLESHISLCSSLSSIRIHKPYIQRLRMLKFILESEHEKALDATITPFDTGKLTEPAGEATSLPVNDSEAHTKRSIKGRISSAAGSFLTDTSSELVDRLDSVPEYR